MNSINLRTLVFLLLFCLIPALPAPHVPLDPFSVSLDGTNEIRSGRYRDAIDTLRRKKSDPDTAFRLFKLGIAYARSGDTVKAVQNLYAAVKDSAIAPLAWEAMADIGISRKNQLDSTLACYGRAITAGMPNKLRLRIFEKIQTAVGDDTVKICKLPFFPDYQQWVTAHKMVHKGPELECLLADSLIQHGLWTPLDSFINRTLTALSDSAQCAIVDAIERAQPQDSLLSTSAFFLLARIAMECRQNVTAEYLLSLAQGKKDFKTVVSGQRLMRFRGKLYFSEKKYEDAARTLTAYLKRYGNESDILLLIARSYRSLDSVEKSAQWYDRYIAQNRKSAVIAEILWRRAWMEVEMGKPANAKRFYRWIYQAFPRSQRAEESCFREALCHFQIEHFDSALKVIKFFETRYATSPFASAAAFWKAKCLLRKEKTEEARTLLTEIADREPVEYYAHRARYYLTLLGDSIHSRLEIDTLSSLPATIAWLDSVGTARKPLLPLDSLNLRRGALLAALGTMDDAEMFLEGVELANPGNLSLGFRIATLYGSLGALPQAARSGRRLSWRVPLEYRSRIPLPVYALMYPCWYGDLVKKDAALWNLDPAFVFAVIRQESIFNPDAVSAVGAIGIMQIMPYTGKAIAQNLKETFAMDSLRVPAVNIRYGTYYLRQLLDQFNEMEVLALASYNGGPPNAKKWFSRNGNMDMDLFIENISFTETRNYVKKVLANYWFYKKLLRVNQCGSASSDASAVRQR